MKALIPFFILLLFLLIIDFTVYRGLRSIFSETPTKLRNLWFVGHWTIPAVVLLGIIVLALFRVGQHSPNFRFYYVIFGIFILFYAIQEIANLLRNLFSGNPVAGGEGISRGNFITKVGLVLAAIPFASIVYGIIKGRFNFTLNRHKIPVANLPELFDGFKIVQLSDIHMGSFAKTDKNKERIRAAIEIINDERPDIIVFTGDLVNNVATEMEGWVETWQQLKAQVGKYSILGNHDYGEYVVWPSEQAKQSNMEKLMEYHKKMGFKLLLNESVILGNSDQQMALLGVENWGNPPFPQYGNLDKAMSGTEEAAVKILLSHDPSHWEAEVREKTDIALTLSGHTHGMQFAIKVGNFNWSPVKWKYKRWRGLYTENKQHLYVNIGFGFIGFPGRVGTDPEISLFELQSV